MSSDDPPIRSRAIDQAIEEAGYDAILARLSNELGTSIRLGDGTIYEDGDRHDPNDMDEPAGENEEISW